MSATLTLTAKTGTAVTMTAAVFPRVEWFTIDADKNMLTMKQDGLIISPVDVGAATTVTATKSGNTWTLTIS